MLIRDDSIGPRRGFNREARITLQLRRTRIALGAPRASARQPATSPIEDLFKQMVLHVLEGMGNPPEQPVGNKRRRSRGGAKARPKPH